MTGIWEAILNGEDSTTTVLPDGTRIQIPHGFRTISKTEADGITTIVVEKDGNQKTFTYGVPIDRVDGFDFGGEYFQSAQDLVDRYHLTVNLNN